MNNLYVIEEQPNPSTDYYVLPAISHANSNIIQCGFKDLPDLDYLNNATIIFVRYIPKAWMKLIDASKDRIKQIILFMDDDLLDVNATKAMPIHYRFKIFSLTTIKSGWLKKNNVRLWVSTPHLFTKYAAWNPALILPKSISSDESCKVFYHGSFTHQAEVSWLRPIIEEVLKKDERISFDIVGKNDTFKLYKGLPRVTTIHPMKWPAYKTFTSNYRAQIGLVPLLNNAFNLSRSYSKFLDITRYDAVGIYTEKSECARVIEHQHSGLIAPMEPQVWIDYILKLANNQEERLRMLTHAKQQVTQLDCLAKKSYSKIDLL